LAARLGGALGRPIEHIDPDPGEWAADVVAAGMPPWLAQALAEYFEVLRDRPLESSGDTWRVTGRNPRSVEEFAIDVLAPAMPAVTGPTTPVLVSPSDDASEGPFVATIPTTHRSQHA
jgi:hypothetical protein